MFVECTLLAIQNFLEKGKLTPRIEKAEDARFADYLILPMGTDDRDRPYEVAFYLFEKSFEQDSQETEKFLQLRYFFPFQFKDESVSDIARYLLFINRSSEYEGFGMSEVDRMVYFHLDLYAAQNKVDSRMLKGLLGYLMLMIDTFGPRIEKIASLEKTFLDIIAEDQP